MGSRASIMALWLYEPDPSLSWCHYLKQTNNGFGERWGNILHQFCCWFSLNQIPLMAKQVCLCGAYPKKLSVCQYWLSWLASVAEMLLINNVSANEYQVWAVRGWFNGTQPLSWSEWPHVWNNLIIWNYLESTTLVLSTEQVLVCACAPLPFQPCTFRAVISLSLYTNHKHRDRRRERASLLCYYLLLLHKHKYITQESQTLHPSSQMSPMLVSMVRFLSSLQGRMSKYTGKVHQS